MTLWEAKFLVKVSGNQLSPRHRIENTGCFGPIWFTISYSSRTSTFSYNRKCHIFVLMIALLISQKSKNTKQQQHVLVIISVWNKRYVDLSNTSITIMGLLPLPTEHDTLTLLTTTPKPARARITSHILLCGSHHLLSSLALTRSNAALLIIDSHIF